MLSGLFDYYEKKRKDSSAYFEYWKASLGLPSAT